MNIGPLTESELEWLDETITRHATESSVIDVSELDGMLTAILSSPQEIDTAVWMQAIWGEVNHAPQWESEDEHEHFTNLILQHRQDIADRLNDYPEQFEPLFGIREEEGQELTVVEEWCYGYLRGVHLSDWSGLPAELQTALESITLHGDVEKSEALDALSVDAFFDSIDNIRPAALALFDYWMDNPK